MANEVRQAIVIGLGEVGGAALASLERRLSERHGGVPTIRLLAINVAEEPEVPAEQNGEIRRLNLSFKLDELLDGHQSSISRWLPGEVGLLAQQKEDLLETRLWGRLALFTHADRVHLEVRDATNDVLAVATHGRLEDRGLQVRERGSLDVFILAALDEPFASGALIDLAYLVAHTVERDVTDRVFVHTSGILFLPSLRSVRGGGDLTSEEMIALRQEEMRCDADAYAALKELDHYMDKGRYRAAYSPGLTFKRDARPFTQACYLLDATNERNKSMKSLAEMTEMAGEWLYQMLASPLMFAFQGADVPLTVRSHRKVAAYSGLGLAAYFLPVDEVIEQCAIREAHEMIGDYFLSTAAEDEGGIPIDVSVQPQEVQDKLQNDANWEVKRAQYINVPQHHFDNISPNDLGRLEGQIRRTFDYRLRQMLPRLRQGMVLNLEEMLKQFRDRLADRVAHSVNASPTGGLSVVRRYLHQMKSDLSQEEGRVAGELKRRAGEREATKARTRDEQANLTAAVSVFGSPWAVACLVVSLLVILVWLWYSLVTFLGKMPQIEALGWVADDAFGVAPVVASVMAVVGTLLALGAAAWVAYDWWKRSLKGYLNAHRQRLALRLETELREVEAQYYRRAKTVVDDQVFEVMDFHTRLGDLQQDLEDEMEKERPLYGAPRFAIEKSVIDEDDVDRFYRELVGDTLEDEILALFTDYGPFYDWKDASDEMILRALRAYGRDKFEILRQIKSAEGLLVEHAARKEGENVDWLRDRLSTADLQRPEVRRGTMRRIDELRENSMPFLAYSDLELDRGVRTSLIHQVSFAGANNADSLVGQLLDDKQTAKIYTADRQRITSMSARHGLPLAAIGVLRRWRMQYEALRGAGSRQLHTQRSHLALPDLFPLGEDLLPPQMAVAVGIAYDKFPQREEDGHYTFQYEDDLQEMVTVDLGADKLDACVYLQDEPVVLRILSEEIEAETERRAKEIGNQSLVRELRLYIRRKGEEDMLEDWEEIMVDDYVLQLER